ncbi:MAG: TPR repeat protein [Bradyrhizobium sp.]|jgi:TPR repeat protein
MKWPGFRTGWPEKPGRAIALVLVGAGVLVAALASDLSPTVLPVLKPAEVDRLRMQASGGRDGAALAALQDAARDGNLDALQAAADVLLQASDPSHLREGLDYARNAAKRGDARAQYLLGKTLFNGNAVQAADRREARVWLERAALQDHSQACYLLGLIYKNGYAGPIDVVAALRWFARGTALGNPDAMFMLGNATLAGEGVPADPSRAMQLFRDAAELEHPLAAQMLAYALRDGSNGLKRDDRAAQEMVHEVEHALHHPRAVF